MKSPLIGLVAFALLAVPAVARAQGSVSGCVRDSLMKPLGPAWLSLTNDATDLRTTTGPDGCFEFREAPPGRYTLRAAVPGFCDGVLERVIVEAGQRVVADFSLKLGPISEVIGFQWKGWKDLLGRSDVVIHARLEEVLDTKASPGKGCGSDFHTALRVRVDSVIQRPHWSNFVPGPMMFLVNRTWSGSPADPPPYKAGDEFIAFLKWIPSLESLELNIEQGGAIVPIKHGRVAWTVSDDGKPVDTLLEELRRLAK